VFSARLITSDQHLYRLPSSPSNLPPASPPATTASDKTSKRSPSGYCARTFLIPLKTRKVKNHREINLPRIHSSPLSPWTKPCHSPSKHTNYSYQGHRVLLARKEGCGGGGGGGCVVRSLQRLDIRFGIYTTDTKGAEADRGGGKR
jgi:hypothetical protein